MLQLLEQLDFPHGGDGEALELVMHKDALKSDHSASLNVRRLEDLTERSMSAS